MNSVRSTGHWMPGASPRSTVMMKLHSSLLPQRSSARQVTVFTPQGKKLPEGGLQTSATEPLLSEAVGAG